MHNQEKGRETGGKWGQWAVERGFGCLGGHKESRENNMKLDSREGIASQALQICHHITRESGLKLI